MTLRNRLLWLFAPLLLLTLLIVYGLSERILLQRFDGEDRSRLLIQAEHLHSLISHDLQRNMALSRSYAWWDYSYQYLLDGNPADFAQRNLDPSRLASLDFDFMVFLDRQGRVAAEQWVPPDPLDMLPIGQEQPRELDSLRSDILARSRQLGSLEHAGDASHGLGQLLLVQGIPLLLVSHAVSNSQGSADPVGTLLAGHFLDDQRLASLKSQVDATLRLLPAGAAQDSWRRLDGTLAAAGLQIRISPRRWLDEERQQVELLLSNALGEAELRLQITKERTLYQQGRQAIRFFLAAALLVALCAMLVVYLGLEFWVLQRIERLQQEVAAIGHDAHLPRLSDLGADELGRLSGALNHMLERLEQSEERDRAILDSIQDGYFEIDAGGKILTVNRALERLLDYPAGQLIGRPFEDVLSAEEVGRARKLFAQARHGQDNGTTAFAAPFKRSDGSLAHFETRVSLLKDTQDQFAGYRGILRDISDQVAYQNQLLDLAYRDSLTGLNNRKAFAEQLTSSLHRAQRQGTALALLYLDLDRFKEVNDRFGHDIGDALLIAIAERLRNTLRQPDRLYRLGGDEFTLLMPNASLEAAQKLAERLLAALASPFELHGVGVDFVTPSIGIALYPEHAREAETLIKAADSAMYQAKQQRNRACLYSAAEHLRQH